MAYFIPYQQLAQMAKPAYADGGELFDGGFDMSTGGICGYVLFNDLSIFTLISMYGFVFILYFYILIY